MKNSHVKRSVCAALAASLSILAAGCSLDAPVPKQESQTEATPSLLFSNVAFKPNSDWQEVGEANLQENDRTFDLVDGQTVLINQNPSDANKIASHLITQDEYGDVQVEFDFKVSTATRSGIVFMGRYRINLSNIYGYKKWWPSDMGALFPRWDETREWKSYDGKAASSNPSKPPGEWQHLSIKFKAPRFDKNGFKTSYAELIDVSFNGVQIQKETIATGPFRFAVAENEVTKGPISFLGNHELIALRNLKIEHADFSNQGSGKAVADADKIPLGPERGQPMFNIVDVGKKAFLSKGCKECHETSATAKSVKTGPSLYGVFASTPKSLDVYDTAEQHATKLKADDNYLIQSIRESNKHIALRTLDNGDTKQFLPIMPSFNEAAISDSEIHALATYLKTLNSGDDQGPLYIWQETPEKPYVIEEDNMAELVADVPRLSRVNISNAVSGRGYHVGLPNHMNYSFDPRTLAIELIWSGRFLNLKNEKQGRADAPSEPGVGAKIWPKSSLQHLFQPIMADGNKVDFSYREPARFNQKVANEMLKSDAEYLDVVNQIDARFMGVDTPLREVPRFQYRVNNNAISMQLALEHDNSIDALFTFDNQTVQQLYIGDTKLSNVDVSVGKVSNGIWQIPAGKHDKVTFKAKVERAPAYEEGTDKPFKASNDPIPLTWTASSNKEQTLPEGYRLESASAPLDNFGRNVLFEPIGIVFNSKGDAYVSTRTAGVWKVTDNQWQQFAEGVFGSLGVVLDDDYTVVIGEKPSLTRLIDADKDGWAEKRENVSDTFRFNSNYHEYLHGPAKMSDGTYVYTLNLAHGLPGGYTAQGSMGTAGGYRGWGIKIHPDGRFDPFVNGLRSPAGIAVNANDEIYYTDNQGDFHGTSKLARLETGKFYGHPAGLVDNVGVGVNSSEISWDTVKASREVAIGLLPHGRAMNSPGNPVWDESESKFGPYKGQMFIGDQSQSNIFRVHLETVDGVEQSALLPFVNHTASGVMRLAFSPKDNSMWIGQTGRGWWAKGGNISSLQRVVWDGKTTPQSMHSISVTSTGYQVNFTQPIANSDRASFDKLAVTSWHYQENDNYGSEEMGNREEVITDLTWSKDGKSVSVNIDNFAIEPSSNPEFTSRVYEFDLTQTEFATGMHPFHAKAWYTLNAIPK